MYSFSSKELQNDRCNVKTRKKIEFLAICILFSEIKQHRARPVLGWAALREPRFIVISTLHSFVLSGMINKSGLDAVAPSYIIKKE
jgi:hypothetical protein